MKRMGFVVRVALAVVLAQLAWTWFERHDANLRIRRMLAGRRERAESSLLRKGGTSKKIVQFYARSADIVDGERNVICYGVQNAKAVRLEPPVEDLRPALVHCFWVKPKQDTTYRLIVDGLDGSRE